MVSPKKITCLNIFQKSQQVSLYNLCNILSFVPPKFRQTVEQKTGFYQCYSVPLWDQLMLLDTVVLRRTNKSTTGGHTVNAYIWHG